MSLGLQSLSLSLLLTYYDMKINYLIINVLLSLIVSCTFDTKSREPLASDLAEDVHSYANFNDVRVHHIELDLSTDFDNKTLDGTAKLYIKNYTQAKNLVLDSRDLKISKILLSDGSQTKYSLGEKNPTFGSALDIDILPNTEWVSVHYETSPEAAALQWLSPQQTLGKKHPFFI